MRGRLPDSVRAALEGHLPSGVKQSVRELLAARFADRVVTYRELSTRDGVTRWTFGTPPSFEFSEPVYYNHLPDEIARLVGRHDCHQPFVLEVPNVEIHGRQGFKLTEDGEYIVFDFWREPTGRDGHGPSMELAYDFVDALGDGTWPFGGRERSPDPPELELAVPLIHRWASNYSHWTEEWLAQLQGVEHYTEQTGERPTLLVPQNPPAFIPESLELLGYGDDYREWSQERVRVNRLVLPSIRRCWSSTSDDYIRDISGLEWVRDRVLANVDIPADRSPTKLLVSREEDADTRRIANWAEVEAALARRGYETVVLTELSFREQKRLFARAEVVVGTHGAGLTEFVYADEAGILELFGDDYIVPPYYEMATGLGHDYACLVCESRGGDLVVELDELLAAVDAVEAAVAE